jgi:hypothetical protein
MAPMCQQMMQVMKKQTDSEVNNTRNASDSD